MNFFSLKFSKQDTPSLANGILLVGSERFRRICAVHVSGTVSVARGYEYDDNLIVERRKLIKSGVLPPTTHTTSVDIEQIAALYTPSASDAAGPGLLIEQATSAEEKLLKLIADAARARASDVKMVQYDHKTIVRAKIAGRWQSAGEPWTAQEGETAMSYAFDAGGDGSGNINKQKMTFQSFSISPKPGFPLPETVIKLRGQRGYQDNEINVGEHMVFRLFYSEDDDVAGDLDDLGLDEEVHTALAQERATDQGCVIMGGSTGDGKSTTLIRVLDRLTQERNHQIDIVTVEDPVEYRSKSEAITQIPVKSSGEGEAREAAYLRTLMHAMRINPDVCLISEIRDGYGAKQVLQFIASGHKGYTTIHVESANAIMFRLISLGVPPAELAAANITLLLKQTLVPILCQDCCLPLPDEGRARAEQFYDITEHHRLNIRNLEGCSTCVGKYNTEQGQKAWAGYARMSAVAEAITPDETYRKFVENYDSIGALAYWLKPKSEGGMGGTPLRSKIAQLVKSGQVDCFDAIRIAFKAGQRG